MRRFQVRTHLASSDPVTGSANDICATLNRRARLDLYDDDEKRLRAVLDDIIDPDHQAVLGLSVVPVETTLAH